MRWRIPVVLSLAIMAGLACSDLPVAPDQEVAAEAPSFKVEKISYRFTLSNEPTETYIDCLGETLLWYGTYDVIWTEKTTPSGNWVASWKLDYFDTDEVTWLEGEDSGVVWELLKAENQGTGWIIKANGPQQMQHWESNEWYMNDQGDKLHIRLKGRFLLDAEGALHSESNQARGFCQ